MVSTENSLLRSKFRGCLLGALLGDSLGAPYEGVTVGSGGKIIKGIIQKYFDTLDSNFEVLFKPYTDDTAMMISVVKFLINKPGPDYTFLAKLFVSEFFNQPRRYGQSVVEVFHKLKAINYENIFQPASEQFLGSGSYGNGGAMRVAPIALYFYKDYKSMLEVATNATKITHTNMLGINGALLQCIAVQQALLSDPDNKIDPKKFCRELREKMKDIEKEDNNDLNKIASTYQEKLKRVESLLERKYDDELDHEVILLLGHGISAYESVTTAIYCFLRAQSKIPYVQTDNLFRRTIQYAITLGGDTDTIACMAGALAGAYLGQDAINPVLTKHCEFNKEIVELADNLFDAREESPVK